MTFVVGRLKRENLAFYLGRQQWFRELVRYVPLPIFAAQLKVEHHNPADFSAAVLNCELDDRLVVDLSFPRASERGLRGSDCAETQEGNKELYAEISHGKTIYSYSLPGNATLQGTAYLHNVCLTVLHPTTSRGRR